MRGAALYALKPSMRRMQCIIEILKALSGKKEKCIARGRDIGLV